MQGRENVVLGVGLLLAWTPVVIAIFRVYGRRNGTLAAVIGGYLFLPPTILTLRGPFHPLYLGKQGAIGLALIVAILVWDAKTLFRFRPRPLDVPALALVIWALVDTLFGQYVEWEVSAAVLGQRLWWLAPYLAARLYFADAEGARRIAVGVVVGSLGLVPVVAFESVMGPSWYLRTVLYRMPAHEGMTERLGFWRPEAFFSHGIELSSWLALATVLAVWLWRGRAWRPRWGPAWGPALALALTTLATVTVYGYIDLALGLMVVAISLRLRTRAAIVALALLTPLYLGARISGVWDGQALVALAKTIAGDTGRESTVNIRLIAETRMIEAILEHDPAFGYDRPLGVSWAQKENEKQFTPGADGGWLVFFWAGGLIGLSIWLIGMQLWPIGLALIEPLKQPGDDDFANPIRGLALFLALGLFDCLHNNPSFTPMALAAGSIVGTTLGGRKAREWQPLTRKATEGVRLGPKPKPKPKVEPKPKPERFSRPAPRVERQLLRDSVRLGAVLAALAIPEILGFLTHKGIGPPPARALTAALPSLPATTTPQTEIKRTIPMQNPVK